MLMPQVAKLEEKLKKGGDGGAGAAVTAKLAKLLDTVERWDSVALLLPALLTRLKSLRVSFPPWPLVFSHTTAPCLEVEDGREREGEKEGVGVSQGRCDGVEEWVCCMRSHHAALWSPSTPLSALRSR
jgi:hypothetical protein